MSLSAIKSLTAINVFNSSSSAFSKNVNAFNGLISAASAIFNTCNGLAPASIASSLADFDSKS